MIEVYRKLGDDRYPWVESTLKALVIDFTVVYVDHNTGLRPQLGDEPDYPFIKHNGSIVGGKEDLLQYLNRMEGFVDEWRRFQSDSCYIDEDGEVC